MSNFVSIGYTKKPHGIKGEIKLQIEEYYLEDLLQAKVVFIRLKGQEVPFFIEEIRVGNNIIGKFEETNTPEAALTISNKEIFLREQDLIPDEDREPEEAGQLSYMRCVGYTIYDKTIGPIGKITEIVEFPQQEMAFIEYLEKEVMIPLNPAFIIRLNKPKKIIEMDLPDGLLEL